MAPEQWTGRRLTRGIDQWALAVMIYEMAEGRLPFHGVSFSDLRDQVLRGQPNEPENLTQRQWEALRISLNADRAQRHRSCLALVKAIAEAEPSTRDSIVLSEMPMPSEAAAVRRETGSGEAPALQPGALVAAPAVAQGTLRPAMAEPVMDDTSVNISDKEDTKRNLRDEAESRRPRTARKRVIVAAVALIAVAAISAGLLRLDSGDQQQEGAFEKKSKVAKAADADTIEPIVIQKGRATDESKESSDVKQVSPALKGEAQGFERGSDDQPVSTETSASKAPVKTELVKQDTPVRLNSDSKTGAQGPQGAMPLDLKRAQLRIDRGGKSFVTSVALSADGTKALTGSDDKMARLWDTTGGKELQTFEGHFGGVRSVALSPDGTKALTGSDDKMARLWDTTSGKELQTFEGHFGGVRSVALSPDGTKALTGSNNTVRLWETNTGNEVQRIVGHSDWIRCVVLSPDGTKVLSGSDDNTSRLWDTTSGKEMQRFEGHFNSVWSVALSPDGTKALTGSDDWTVRLWDTNTGKQLQRFEGHFNGVRSVAFSSDGTKALTGSADGTARLWDTNTGKELQRLEMHGAVKGGWFVAGGERVVAASSEGTLHLWDINSGAEICRILLLNDGTFVVVAPDGQYDSSRSGSAPHVYWWLDGKQIPLDETKDQYYVPGLAKELLTGGK
jgi:WD40 repeat protein